MARFRKVDVRVWGDARFRALSPIPPCGQGLFFWLLTNPDTTNIPGLYRAGEASMAEALGWSIEAFREAFREAFDQGMVEADWKARVVWLPKAIRYNEPESPNVVRGWRATWPEIPECDLKERAREALSAYARERGEAFFQAFNAACPSAHPLAKPSRKGAAKASPKPAPHPSPNQEQEQEQEQEQVKSPGFALAPPPPAETPPPDPPPTDEKAESIAKQIAALESRYPAALIADVRYVLGLSRNRTGKISDPPWLRTLERMSKFPAPHVAKCLHKFVEKHRDGSKTEDYLVAIVAGEFKPPVTGMLGGMTAPSTAFAEGDPDEDYDRAMRREAVA